MVNMFVDNAFRFAVFAGYPYGDDLDGTVGAIVLTYPAAVAAMLIVFIVGHNYLAFETIQHLQFFPILGILLCDDLPGAEEIPARDRHPCQQGFHPVENICKVFKEAVHSKLKMPVH